LETKARDLYDSYLQKVKDHTIANSLSLIHDQEIGHMKLASEVITTIRKYIPDHFERKRKESLVDYLEKEGLVDFDDTSTVLISSDVEKYWKTNLAVLKYLVNQKKLKCIYITVNKPSFSLVEAFKREEIDVNNLYFVDCTTVGTEDSRKIFVKPESLSDISIAVSRLAENISEKKFVYFDAISTLYIFNPSDTVEKFVHYLIPKLKADKIGLILVAVKDEIEKKSLTVLTTFCDSKVEL